MGYVFGFIGFLLALVVIVSIVDVVRRHLGGGRAAAWILLLVIFPFGGAILYWVLRKPSADEVERLAAGERDMRHVSSTKTHAHP